MLGWKMESWQESTKENKMPIASVAEHDSYDALIHTRQ